MNTMTEDTLVQQTTADYLLNDLHWDESIYGMDEVLGNEGTLGRESEKGMVLTRYLGIFNIMMKMTNYQVGIHSSFINC
jgi:type I restriction enzyme, R subunit